MYDYVILGYLNRARLVESAVTYSLVVINSSVPMNIWSYDHRPYICWRARRLTDEFILYSLV
jgi:hypothetical protein